jgi:hypothetical protein
LQLASKGLVGINLVAGIVAYNDGPKFGGQIVNCEHLTGIKCVGISTLIELVEEGLERFETRVILD